MLPSLTALVPIPGTHMMGEESQLHSCPLNSTFAPWHMCTHMHTHTYTQNNILKEQSNDILLTILTPEYSIKNVTAGHSTTGL